jgi:hypothetical protein
MGGAIRPWASLLLLAAARRERGYFWCGYTETDLGR